MIKYIETKPIKQILNFEDNASYNEFFRKRIQEVLDYTFPNNINFKEYFEYKRVMLNKNGTPRKEINPNSWLHSKKAQANQKKGFKKYCEKRKKETLEKGHRRRLAEIDFKIDYWKKQRQMEVANYTKEYF